MTDDGTADLGDLLMRAARTLRRRWRSVLAPWDLSSHQARALAVVGKEDGVRLTDLAEALHIAPRSATEVADGLQERGLVERTPDPGDRRAVILRPTDEGRRVRAEIDAARTQDSAELFARLPAADRTELARILQSLADRRRAGQDQDAVALSHGRRGPPTRRRCDDLVRGDRGDPAAGARSAAAGAATGPDIR